MRVTRDVIHDLLPAYLAGEASADTTALVEEFLQTDHELAGTVEKLRGNPLTEVAVPLKATKEKETLEMTKRLLKWRGILMGFAIFLTLLPLSFAFGDGRITWTFLEGSPPHVTALVVLAAFSCWIAYGYVRRRLRSSGL